MKPSEVKTATGLFDESLVSLGLLLYVWYLNGEELAGQAAQIQHRRFGQDYGIMNTCEN